MQLELNLERLRMAVDDLLIKLAKTFSKPKLQTVFLINNYDMTIAVLKVHNHLIYAFGSMICVTIKSFKILVLKDLLDCQELNILRPLTTIVAQPFSSGFQEAGPEGGKIQMHFEELLKSNTAIFVVTSCSLPIAFGCSTVRFFFHNKTKLK